jgi:hypothetical protein
VKTQPVVEPDIDKPQVSELTKELLESGLVDESMVAMMERWGTLPEGSTQYVNNDALKEATRAQLTQLTEKIAVEVEKRRRIRETNLDLNRLRWPINVYISDTSTKRTGSRDEWLRFLNESHSKFTAMRDRMGRYFFRPDDLRITRSKVVPGFYIINADTGAEEVVAEVDALYVGEDVAAIQVSVIRTDANTVED